MTLTPDLSTKVVQHWSSTSLSIHQVHKSLQQKLAEPNSCQHYASSTTTTTSSHGFWQPWVITHITNSSSYTHGVRSFFRDVSDQFVSHRLNSWKDSEMSLCEAPTRAHPAIRHWPLHATSSTNQGACGLHTRRRQKRTGEKGKFACQESVQSTRHYLTSESDSSSHWRQLPSSQNKLISY